MTNEQDFINDNGQEKIETPENAEVTEDVSFPSDKQSQNAEETASKIEAEDVTEKISAENSASFHL